MADPITSEAPAILTEAIHRARNEEFVLEWTERSNIQRQHRIPILDEMLDNYYVVPLGHRYGVPDRATLGTRFVIPPSASRRSVLKDPESHQIIETLLAKIVGLTLGVPDSIVAVPVGREDVEGASTVSALIEIALTQPGSFRALFEWLKDVAIFGNGYIEAGWQLEYDRVLQRFRITNDAGLVGSGFGFPLVPVKDNFFLRARDPYDVFRDPSVARFDDGEGFVIRGRVSEQTARDLVEQGRWNEEETEEAIRAGSKDFESSDRWGEKTARQELSAPPDAYGMMTTFQFWGKVPWKPDDGMEHFGGGVRRRVITILNGRCVEEGPIKLLGGKGPLVEGIMNPVEGRPWGLTPLEAIRYLQDHADVMLMLLQDASIDAVRGGFLVESGTGLDPAALDRRRVGQSFKVNTKDAVGVLPLSTNGFLQAAASYESRIQRMREAAGATDPVQGITSGGRRSATEASELFRSSIGRADLMARVLEEDAFPVLGRMIHDRYRQFIPDEGMLMRRVGEKQPFEVSFFDIDAEFDLHFVGSRQTVSRTQRATQLRDAILVLQQNPFVASRVDWTKLISLYLEEGLQRRDFEKFLRSEEEAMGQLSVMGALRGQGQPGIPEMGPEGNAAAAEVGGAELM